MEKLKIIILGSGPSGGVPAIGMNGPFWGQCNPENPKNKRSRASIYVEYENGPKLLVDTSPDLRQQYFDNGLRGLSAVLFSHDHADHTHGIDELRSLYFSRGNKAIPVYGDALTIEALKNRFSYLFNPTTDVYPKVVDPVIFAYGDFDIEGKTIKAFPQGHGESISVGFRFADFAYSTDFLHLNDEALDALKNLKLWVVDCLSIDPRKTHNHLELTLEWIKRVKPEKAILTHMNYSLDYDSLIKGLPKNIVPAHDGMTILL